MIYRDFTCVSSSSIMNHNELIVGAPKTKSTWMDPYRRLSTMTNNITKRSQIIWPSLHVHKKNLHCRCLGSLLNMTVLIEEYINSRNLICITLIHYETTPEQSWVTYWFTVQTFWFPFTVTQFQKSAKSSALQAKKPTKRNAQNKIK